MKTRAWMLAFMLAFVLLFSACSAYSGSLPAAPQGPDGLSPAPANGAAIALIATEERLEDDFGQGVRDAVSRYAGENGHTVSTYKTEADVPEAASSTLELAVTSGASLVVAMDPTVSAALNVVAGRYPAVDFVLLDAQNLAPRANVAAVAYNKTQAGWLAGYAAMQKQRGTLGLVSLSDDESQLYSLGFLLGADAAAAELRLSEGATRLFQVTLDEVPDEAGQTPVLAPDASAAQPGGEDEATAETRAIRSLYEWGAGVVFAAAGQVQQQTRQAALESAGQMIAIGLPLDGAYGSGVLASVQYDASELVYQLLGRWDAGALSMGDWVLGGVADGSVLLTLEPAHFTPPVARALEHVSKQFEDGSLARYLERLVAQNEQGERPDAEALGLKYLVVGPPGPPEDLETQVGDGPVVSSEVTGPLGKR